MTLQAELEPKALSIDEASRYVGLGKTTLYGLAREGRLKLVKVGRKTIILVADLDALLDSFAEKALEVLGESERPARANGSFGEVRL